jgi:hypothetical protein
MVKEIYKRAKRVAEDYFYRKEGSFDFRVEVAPRDGKMLLYISVSKTDDPISIFRLNSKELKGVFSAPVIIDPKNGLFAHRFVIPYNLWVKPQILRSVLDGKRQINANDPWQSTLFLMKSIPEGTSEHRYGRGGKLRLIFDRQPVLLAVQVFPGGLVESDLSIRSARLSHAGLVLLARAGIEDRPYSFHMLRESSFFHMERATEIFGSVSKDQLKYIEMGLIRQADADRKIVRALISPNVPLSSLIDKQSIIPEEEGE